MYVEHMGMGRLRSSDTSRQPPYTGEQRRLGLLIRCFLAFKGEPFVIQTDDSFDDDAYGQERTRSNPQALLREETRAVAAIYERARTGGNVFLNRRLAVLSEAPCRALLLLHSARGTVVPEWGATLAACVAPSGERTFDVRTRRHDAMTP